jgi:uncharacterized protein (TIGR01777 family)
VNKVKKQKVVIAGGSGFLGQALAHSLLADKYDVVLLGRRGNQKRRLLGRLVEWDGKNLAQWIDELEGADTLFNLTGRSVDCRYTQENRELILNSRIDSTRVLGEGIAQCNNPPKAWFNASTATIYSDQRGDLPPHDESSKGNAEGFSEEVGRAWEKEFFSHSRKDLRQVAMRISIVLGKGGGAFPVMKRFAKLGLGGAQGPGSQWMSWLHIDDWVGIARFLMETKSIVGPVNLAAPNPITNSEFMRAMREHYAPFSLGLPAPNFAVHLGAFFLGTSAELVLKSRKVISQVLSDNGYEFLFTNARDSVIQLGKKAE